MRSVEVCSEFLCYLIAMGDVDYLAAANRALNEYLGTNPDEAKINGLRRLRETVLVQRDGAAGDQRNFAAIVNIYIEQKIAE